MQLEHMFVEYLFNLKKIDFDKYNILEDSIFPFAIFFI
jgi:hypothetical protein